MGEDLRGSRVGALSRNLPGMAEENQEEPQLE
jgi:hypothetical protein